MVKALAPVLFTLHEHWSMSTDQLAEAIGVDPAVIAALTCDYWEYHDTVS